MLRLRAIGTCTGSHRGIGALGGALAASFAVVGIGTDNWRVGTRPHPIAVPQLDFGQTSRTLDATKHLFDAFAAALADVIAGMTSGASRRPPSCAACRSY
jgi:hypothetical protein